VLGILQRYVICEVVRAFLMALTTMTIIFVLFMVMAEATNMGLTPHEIFNLVPFVIPSTLPYTVPVSMLFAVTVVYGRLASDNEIIAVKTAGVSPMALLWPTVLIGAVLSAALLLSTGTVIPRATHQARLVVFKDLEDVFYKVLKKEREFNRPDWPFLIHVRDVIGKTMYEATFKHRSKSGQNPYDRVIQARTARIDFDLVKNIARVYLDGAEIEGGSVKDDIFLVNDRFFDIDLPDKGSGLEKRIQEWTTTELISEQAKMRMLIVRERKRRAIEAAFGFASGRVDKIEWASVDDAFRNHAFWTKRLSEYETEKQMRVAQSFGPLLFVILGAPVGILFAKRDFLSAFISCFVPIILLYYPLMLLGMNMGKEGSVNPIVALWSGNVVLAVLAGFVTPPVIRH
jgi:lipopolysaccharide export system permease protein